MSNPLWGGGKVYPLPNPDASQFCCTQPNKRGVRDLLFSPGADFSINSHISGGGSMQIGAVYPFNGGYEVLFRAGSGARVDRLDIPSCSRFSRQAVAKAVAQHLTGHTIERDNWNGYSGQVTA